MNKRKAAKILRNAAKTIETYGWVKGRLGNENIGFCTIGAIYHNHGAYSDQCDTAIDALQRVLCDSDVASWNDRIAKDSKEVTRAMRKTANALEHGLVVY